MSGRLTSMFEQLKGQRAALITYATGCFPDADGSEEVISRMLESGADAVEIGLPFSDPVMDGPVIQETSRIALRAGSSVGVVLGLASRIREKTDKPLLVMTYYNPVFHYGLGDFAWDAVRCGVDGVVIPDLPAEEMLPWKVECDDAGLETVVFCAPTTGEERIRLASSLTTGFMYCVALLGTTGPRDEVSPELPSFLERVRANADCPIAVGVGISTPAQCAQVGRMADGVIVGSALMRVVNAEGPRSESLSRLTTDFRSALS